MTYPGTKYFLSVVNCVAAFTESAMEPIMNQIWRRVFQRFQRTSILTRRSHSASAEHIPAPASTNSRPLKPPHLVSRLYQPSNLRDMGQDTRLQGEMTCKSQRLMLQAGLIYPSNPGCYYYLPATVRSMEKLVRPVFVTEYCHVSMQNLSNHLIQRLVKQARVLCWSYYFQNSSF